MPVRLPPNFSCLRLFGRSPLSGIGPGSNPSFFTNTGEVVCDGDLLVRGTLFLNQPVIATRTGCRIYATGPAFLQGAITYKTRDGSADKANLQLVSAKAILLGLGDKSCDATYKDSPRDHHGAGLCQ